MLTLHGAPLSNFYNIARQAILEKGLDCEFVFTRPSQEPAFLEKSPMGKVPMLETAEGCLTETDVILDYLEDAGAGKPLLPAEPFARARVRQVMKVAELYVEAPLHPLIGKYFGREVPQSVKEASLPAARRGMAALARLISCSPWICGDSVTLADIYLFHSLTLAHSLAQDEHGWDLLGEIPGLQAWYERFGEREFSRQVLGENRAAFAAFLEATKTSA